MYYELVNSAQRFFPAPKQTMVNLNNDWFNSVLSEPIRGLPIKCASKPRNRARREFIGVCVSSNNVDSIAYDLHGKKRKFGFWRLLNADELKEYSDWYYSREDRKKVKASVEEDKLLTEQDKFAKMFSESVQEGRIKIQVNIENMHGMHELVTRIEVDGAIVSMSKSPVSSTF